MITERDQIALDFLKQFKVATVHQLNEVAYHNLKVAYKRLNILHKDKLIYKTSNPVNQGILFSFYRVRSTRQLQHKLLRNDFYIKLLQLTTIHTLYVEAIFGSIQPDLTVICTYKNNDYFFTLEVETTSNHSAIDYDKYNRFFGREWRNHFNATPTVVYMTDKKVNASKIQYTYKPVMTDLNNIIDIFQ